MADEQAIRRERLGQLVRQARGTERLEDAATRAGVSTRTWSSIEKGLSSKPFSVAKVEKALGWPAGSVGRFLITGNEAALQQQPEGKSVIDWVLDLARPDAIKVIVIRAIRHSSDPLGALLDGDVDPAVKVEAIETLREAQALQAQAANREDRKTAETG